MSYAGDLNPTEAWKLLNQDQSAQLVDVRTRPEWMFVGLPDLTSLGRRAVLQSWQVFPAMEVDDNFVAELAQQLPDMEAPILFICRSGGRSRAAAAALTAAGYRRCYNVAEGFEGNPDPERHRGKTGGWKAAGLPWVQD
ncbi:MAG TPA: rhodanese-like domain-containing protein [Dongiaceae bacterium]|jgi:rhodanese-related sulfurtransferase